jgi:L-2,4-diaminobutyric acid acetyltransferase
MRERIGSHTLRKVSLLEPGTTRNLSNHENDQQKSTSTWNTKALAGEIVLARPIPRDAADVHALISVCKPLDLNSTYAYLLLCHHHAETCVIARSSDDAVGFISAYVLPRDPQTFFVWQVAVHPGARGKQLGVRMLSNLVARDSAAATRFLETTVSPSNSASRRMFQRFAREIGVPVQEQMLFDRDVFGNEEHEEEVLLRIGPFDTDQLRKEMQ